MNPPKISQKGSHPASRSEILLGSLRVGQPGNFAVIAGPCSVDQEERYLQAARELRNLGATALRGGVYKMRTRMDSFQGLREAGFPILKKVRQEVGLPVVTEVVDPRHVEALCEVVDVFQVGARNMYNYELLKELGRVDRPVLLKRSFSAYIDEWIGSAEYIERSGNSKIIFCERGIRSFDRYTRNTIDFAAVPYLKAKTGLPVFVDPSHGTGRSDLVVPMCLAAAAAGADGLLVEVHPDPEEALSDQDQALTLPVFSEMMTRLERLLAALGSQLVQPVSSPSVEGVSCES